MTNFYGLFAAGLWKEKRGANIIDSGAYFYDVFECSDGRWISVAPIEEKFYIQFLEHIGLDPQALPPRSERERWPEGREILAKHLRQRTAAEWCALLEGVDACVGPVLQLSEAPEHPHLKARNTFLELDGIVQPAPQPQFSRTPPSAPTPPAMDRGRNPEDALQDWQIPAERIAELRAAGVVG
jgi:alpha-methylacyl-CoA racemase